MKQFVGSKGAPGIAQWIISHMPVHRTYVEAFLGRGVVLRTKLSAAQNIGIESDPKVISSYWRSNTVKDGDGRRQSQSRLTVLEGDALTILPALQLDSTALVYADPPYLGSARKDSNRVYYGRELMSEADHEQLLSVLTSLQANVMVSGYRSQLYDIRLQGWRTDSKWSMTRRGKVEEFLWMNFDPPLFFHDTRFMGLDFTDRQRIKRKIARWKRKFEAMRDPKERFAILEALQVVASTCGSEHKPWETSVCANGSADNRPDH